MTSTAPPRRTEEPSPAMEAPRPPIGWAFLRSRRWCGYYALFIIFSITCVMLGNWQFDRRAEARAEIDRIDANYNAPAVPLVDELPTLEGFDEEAQKWRTITVAGEYLDTVFLARNRPGPQGVGANLMQGLRTEEGRVFFVERGWVPFQADPDAGDPENPSLGLQNPPLAASGEVTVEARLRASEPAVDGRSSYGATVASIDLPELARLAGTEGATYTGAYGMLIEETPAGEHGELAPKPERDEGPHLSYALQWYIFILIALCGLGYAARLEYRGLNSGSDAVKRQDRRRAERKERRGPSDADEEDALLDG